MAETFPDVVALSRVSGVVHCTGIIVGPGLVLTARHCLPTATVTTGNDVHKATTSYRVTGATPYPDPTVDIALVAVEGLLPLSTHARRLNPLAAAPLGVVRLVGFGATELTGQDGAGIKRFVDVTVTGWGCDDARSTRFGCRVAGEMLIPRQGDADTCDGDSGGPVFERIDHGFRLVAITSRAVLGSRKRCGDGGIYTRVDRISAWIDAQLTQ